MKHTPEPWSFSDGLGHYEGSVVITSKTMTESTPLAVISDICGDANIDARRIVACVNACVGMPDESLNGANLKNQLDRHYDEIVNVTRQRDELLAALKDCNEIMRGRKVINSVAALNLLDEHSRLIAKCEAQS